MIDLAEQFLPLLVLGLDCAGQGYCAVFQLDNLGGNFRFQGGAHLGHGFVVLRGFLLFIQARLNHKTANCCCGSAGVVSNTGARLGAAIDTGKYGAYAGDYLAVALGIQLSRLDYGVVGGATKILVGQMHLLGESVVVVLHGIYIEVIPFADLANPGQDAVVFRR